MDAKCFKLYNEEDIEIHEKGIFLNDTFFSKRQIADAFNELILTNQFIENQCR